MAPSDGSWRPERMLSSVVLPHPEGPTIATNSPGEISSERLRKTSIGPNDLHTRSSKKALALITPPDARDALQLYEHTIDGYAHQSDYEHLDYKYVGTQTIPGIHDGEAQTVAPRDHLGGYHHQPRDRS